MDVDAEKVQQAVLAPLYLNTFDEKSGKRPWKALPWSVMDQLHDKGYISDPGPAGPYLIERQGNRKLLGGTGLAKHQQSPALGTYSLAMPGDTATRPKR
jgi:hypothetical protein